MKTKILFSVLTLIALMLLPKVARAQAVERIQIEKLFDYRSGRSLVPKADMKTFERIADEQAQVWGDTILEGDYRVEGPTRVDRIEALKDRGTILLYRLFYSQKAWDTVSNEEGRIQEASFVSSDLSSWERDPAAFAEFQSN